MTISVHTADDKIAQVERKIQIHRDQLKNGLPGVPASSFSAADREAIQAKIREAEAERDRLAGSRDDEALRKSYERLAASAAYWIVSAADEIVADRSAEFGSIGVRMAVSKQLERDSEGEITFDVVSSGAPLKLPDPQTEAGLAALKVELDDLEDLFVGAVAQHRGVSADTVRTRFGSGGMMIAGKAVAAGMADAIGTFEGALARAKALGATPRAAAPAPTAIAHAAATPALPATVARATPQAVVAVPSVAAIVSAPATPPTKVKTMNANDPDFTPRRTRRRNPPIEIRACCRASSAARAPMSPT